MDYSFLLFPYFFLVIYREMQAKAKRLARFNVELSENVQISPEITDKKVSNSGRGQSVVERQKFVGGHSIESAKDYPNENTLSDNEGLEASSVIIGSCPDMCPGMCLFS